MGLLTNLRLSSSPAFRTRGGTTYYHGLYPDALSNVVHGYAELDKHTDEEVEHLHEVQATAGTKTKKHPHWSDEDYDEDPFFHVLYHNNDDIESVETVSTDPKRGRIDLEMFEKLHHRIFDHDEAVEHETPEEKVSVDVHDVIDDMFE